MVEEEEEEEEEEEKPALSNNTNTTRAPMATGEDNTTDEYAQPQKHNKTEEREKNETFNSKTTTTEPPMEATGIRRCNTIGAVLPSERPRSQILRRNTESSKTKKEPLLPDKDVVYQHTTSVVKSVIEFNTGVQHAQPDEFVDLVKVCFSHKTFNQRVIIR